MQGAFATRGKMILPITHVKTEIVMNELIELGYIVVETKSSAMGSFVETATLISTRTPQ
jgi:hypothetical protein